jgi:hypothetical protein
MRTDPILSPAAPTPSSGWWMEQARSNYASADYGHFRIITNTGPVQLSGQVQEFLTRRQSSDAPDPVAAVTATAREGRAGATISCGLHGPSHPAQSHPCLSDARSP